MLRNESISDTMITGEISDIGFLGDGSLNNCPIFYPRNPELIFKFDNFLKIYHKSGKYIYSTTPRITMFSCLRELKRGKELRDMIIEEFGVKMEKKELKNLLYTISLSFLSKKGKIKFKALDMDVDLDENQYFLDAGYVRKSILIARGRCFDYSIDTLHIQEGKEKEKKTNKFVVFFYRKYKNEDENLLIRGHEEAHALDKIGKFNLLEEELSKYQILRGIEDLNCEGRAFLGTGLVALKTGQVDSSFNVIDFAKKLQ